MSYITDFFKNLKTTALSIGITDIIEILIIAFVVYKLIVWMKNTRTWFVLKGILVIVILFIVAEFLQLNTILYIAKSALDFLVIALLVVFQPELRSALEKLGKESALFKFFTKSDNNSAHDLTVAARDQIATAVFELGEEKTGALIVIEREYPLGEYTKSGITLDSDISKQLLENIFEHNTPLHDGAVIVRGNKILAAACILPLSYSLNISQKFGTRHRAAIGVSEATDAVAIVVSEETGRISLSKDGKLQENLSMAELKKELEDIIKVEEVPTKKIFKRRQDNEETNS